MAEAIIIKIGLDASDITQATGKIRSGIKSALDAAIPDAKEVGRRIGSALSDGIAEGLKKASALKAQLTQVLGDGQKTVEAQERAHQQRLAEIRERGAQQQATIAARAAAQAERDARKLAETQERLARRAAPPDSAITFFKRYSSTIREAGESIQQAGYGLLGLTAGILNVGKSAVQSAVNIDRQVNVLKALTGSAQAAEERFASLVKLSSQTPGLTTSLAATLDAQLRVANVGAGTIDKLLPAIGRLNAVSPLGDPQKFAQNLTQLITQGFERADLKELIGQSPLAGEIIKSLFNVDSATNSKAIKEAAQKLGLTTTDAFFAAFAQAAQNNPKLANITESLGTQFEKLRDRVLVALRPLGLAIVQALTPLVESAVPIIERLSSAFSALPQSAQQALIVLAALAAAVGPLVIAFGGLIQTFGALGNLFTVLSALFTGGGAVAGIAATVGGIAAAVPPVALALGGLAIVIGGVVAAYQLFGSTVEQTAAKTTAGLVASQERVKVGQQEIDGLRNLQEQTSLNAAEQAKIKALYDALDPVQKARVGVYAEESGGVETLTGKLAGLVQVLDETNQKRLEAQRIAATEAGAGIVNDLQINGLRDFGDKIDGINKQIEEYAKKQVDAERTGERFGRSLAGPGVAAADVYAGKIRDLSGELNSIKSLADANQKQYIALGNAFREAAKASGKTTDEFIKQAIAASGLGGDLAGLERRLRQLAGVGASASAPSRAALLARGASAETIDPAKPKPSGLGSGSGESAESKARQLREAQLAQQKSFLEQNQRLLEDANKRELESLRELYDEKAISTRAYFDEKTRLEQSSIQSAISVTQQEIANAEAALTKTKPGSLERIRLESELFKLRTDLTIKSREFYGQEIDNIQATTKALLTQRKELLDDLKSFTVKLDESQLPTAQIKSSPSAIEEQAREKLREVDAAIRIGRVADLELREKELQIQNLITTGVINESEGKSATLAIQREYRDVLIQSLEAQKAIEIDPEKLASLRVQIEQLKTLGQELSPAQAFFKGFKSEAETLAESFERIGKSFKDSVLGVVDSGIDKLTQKLGFFKSLVGDILKSLTRALLGGLLNGRGGAAGGSGGGGIGGFLGNLLGGGSGGGLGSILTNGSGGGAASVIGGSGSGLIKTLSKAVGGEGLKVGSASSGISGIVKEALDLTKGGNLAAPASLSLGGLIPAFGKVPTLGLRGPGAGELSASGRSVIGSAGLFGNLFSGIGFGKAAGSGGALASALPLLGLSLGASVGTDRLTSIIGGAGGLALGVGLTAAPAALAGGSLSFLAPLFSNPFTAIAGGAALVGAFLLGRARQRKRDEKSSGDSLQDAIDQIRDVRKQVESNELTLTVSDARKLFDSQILAPFVAQINQLKSKSVRESRLKNQTVDLRNLFEKEVIPAVQLQKSRQGISDKLIPEFAFGGVVPGRPTPGIDSVLARLSPGEMVLTTSHQAALQSIAGRNVFQAIGVPDAGQSVGDGSQAFARGGFVSAAARAFDTPPVINMTVQLVVSSDDATEILNAAASTDGGQQILVSAQRAARRNRLN